jgi:hypothetical protein
MAETPDFKATAQIAIDEIFADTSRKFDPDRDLPLLAAAIVEQLRLVWNARGAADIVKLEAELAAQMGVTASGPYVKNLDRALRSLDRSAESGPWTTPFQSVKRST